MAKQLYLSDRQIKALRLLIATNTGKKEKKFEQSACGIEKDSDLCTPETTAGQREKREEKKIKK